MTNVNVRVAASADDAYDSDDGGFPGYSHTASIVYTGHVTPRDMIAGFRFLNVDIPSGATIDTVTNPPTITLTDEGFPGGDHDVTVYLEDSGASPATFSSGSTPNDRTWTTNSVSWSITEPSPGNTVESPALDTEFQEVVDSYSGITHAVVIIDGVGSGTNNEWDSYDGSASEAALLDLDYTGGGGGDPEGLLIGGKLVGNGLLMRGVLR